MRIPFLSALFERLPGRRFFRPPSLAPAPELDVDDCFAHYTERVLGHDPVPSAFPVECRDALADILTSPIGSPIARHVRRTGGRVKLATSAAPDVAFSVIDDFIYYTTDIDAYLAKRKHDIPHTLGSLLAHEIGHVIGKVKGMPVTEEEIHVTRHYENPYREYKCLPLRTGYYEPGDVC